MTTPSRLYPLKYSPLLKDKIWGGTKLSEVLNKDASDKAGESWEVSAITGSESVVVNGFLRGKSLPDLISEYKGHFLGNKTFEKYGAEFPLLIKFIHAKEDLSIQVHPSDEQSGGSGKTEMWYVLWAEDGANLLSGFNQEVDAATLRSSIDQGSFEQYMNRIPVTAGDTFFIPANQVHTIGGGMMIAEIQQSSDITYRIYDFNRTDDKGQKRELHIDQAFSVMDIGKGTGKVEYDKRGELVQLVTCPEFVTNKFVLTAPRNFITGSDRFKIYMNVGGTAIVNFDNSSMPFGFGETLFLPANTSMEIVPKGEMSILETMPGN